LAGFFDAALAGDDVVSQIDREEIRFFLVAASGQRPFRAFGDNATVVLGRMSAPLLESGGGS
jgi:hypothetical protein